MSSNSKVCEWLDDDNLKRIKGWARDGLTDTQIAHNMGISRSCLYKWIKDNPIIDETIRDGRRPIVVDLESTLIKTALGYFDEVNEYHPPNIHSLLFALKNYRPDKFTDKPKSEIEVKTMELDNQLKELKVKELDKILNSQSDNELYLKFLSSELNNATVVDNPNKKDE